MPMVCRIVAGGASGQRWHFSGTTSRRPRYSWVTRAASFSGLMFGLISLLTACSGRESAHARTGFGDHTEPSPPRYWPGIPQKGVERKTALRGGPHAYPSHPSLRMRFNEKGRPDALVALGRIRSTRDTDDPRIHCRSCRGVVLEVVVSILALRRMVKFDMSREKAEQILSECGVSSSSMAVHND